MESKLHYRSCSVSKPAGKKYLKCVPIHLSKAENHVTYFCYFVPVSARFGYSMNFYAVKCRDLVIVYCYLIISIVRADFPTQPRAKLISYFSSRLYAGKI